MPSIFWWEICTNLSKIILTICFAKSKPALLFLAIQCEFPNCHLKYVYLCLHSFGWSENRIITISDIIGFIHEILRHWRLHGFARSWKRKGNEYITPDSIYKGIFSCMADVKSIDLCCMVPYVSFSTGNLTYKPEMAVVWTRVIHLIHSKWNITSQFARQPSFFNLIKCSWNIDLYGLDSGTALNQYQTYC